ncbi:hypothetical protein J7643_10115 [bacterium]|nr:hypothetical protein [bacterium]
MRRWASALALASVLAVVSPADAAINLNSDFVPDPGRMELLTYGYYSPYTLRVLNGAVYSANPVGSAYHWFEAWNSFEVGLLPDTSLTILAPFDLTQSFDGSDRYTGLTDLSVALGRKLWSNDLGGLKARLRVNAPVGPLGSEAHSVGLDTMLSQAIIPEVLTATANFNYRYSLHQTVRDEETLLPHTSWAGHVAELSLGVDYAMSPSFDLVFEVLGQFEGRAESDRKPDPASGAMVLTLAPGLNWKFNDQFSLQASLLAPVLRGGYQDSYSFGGLAGICLDF